MLPAREPEAWYTSPNYAKAFTYLAGKRLHCAGTLSNRYAARLHLHGAKSQCGGPIFIWLVRESSSAVGFRTPAMNNCTAAVKITA